MSISASYNGAQGRFDPQKVEKTLRRSAQRRADGRWDGCQDTTRRFHAVMFNLTLAAERKSFDEAWEAATGKNAKETDEYLTLANARIKAIRASKRAAKKEAA